MKLRASVMVMTAIAMALVASPSQAVAPTWADEAEDFNSLPLLCDGDISFTYDDNAPALKGKKAVTEYMVTQAAFGSGVEVRSHLVRVRAATLPDSNFVTGFDAIYDVLAGDPYTVDIANAYALELDETVAALQDQSKALKLQIYENAESQGGNLEQLFVYDPVNTAFGLLILRCG